MVTCQGRTKKGIQCKCRAVKGDRFCSHHSKVKFPSIRKLKQFQRRRAPLPQKRLKERQMPPPMLSKEAIQRVERRRLLMEELEPGRGSFWDELNKSDNTPLMSQILLDKLINTKCVKSNLASHNIRIDKLLGKGRVGAVYAACTRDACSFVLKMVAIPRPGEKDLRKDTMSRESFDQEVSRQSLAASYGIAPRVYDNWLCAGADSIYNLGFIMMERWDISAMHAIRDKPDLEIPTVLVDDLKRKYIRFHRATGLINKDIHFGNLFVKYSGNVATKLALGDWGATERGPINLGDIDEAVFYYGK